ncbi:MAG TPA: phosphoribosyltransferase [Roseiflexaceae bacterium]|nr:phosphoribosyltransferase [Roseiflexaceae bacterium]
MLTQPTIDSEISIPSLIDIDERYADRGAAGRQLAQLLRPDRDSRALVFALPPGGVVVGGEVARALRLPLDVLVAREIAIRPYPALVAGALCEGSGLCLNRAVFRLPGATLKAFWHEAHRTAREIAALVVLYRHGRSLPLLQRRSVILVDDGLGDGLMQLAAIRALRRMHAARCVVVTPFATPDAFQRVARRADLVLTLSSSAASQQDGHGHWGYPLDDDVAAALAEAYRQQRGDGS